MKYFLFFTGLFLFAAKVSLGQNTQIKGFIDVLSTYDQDKISFGFGEQDLFITSVINDRISFLGESVFKYTPSSPTDFSVSIERVIINYNIKGNNSLIMGKIHTPINYWNDTYHHGRVFFPTIERPLLFAANIIPLHTVGIGVHGHDLSKVKFGYDVFIGNGLGSSEIIDNDKNKSITTAIYIKPADKWRFGASWYYDVVAKGANVHEKIINWKVKQHLFTASVSRFGKKLELLAESTAGLNHTDTTGTKTTLASYIYTGYRATEKLTPYVRFDDIHYQPGELFYDKNNTTSIVAGIRYEINYLAVIKLEYQYQHSELLNNTNKVTAQFAIGF
ncbi:MAG: hypothetical protein M3Z92_04035 [Bacteroidota bacterium]|nr:hypothetical protein [Bacteroidota bacterium]MDQ6888743.1 hypothetical protein [Bacteroidota bacterium]